MPSPSKNIPKTSVTLVTATLSKRAKNEPLKGDNRPKRKRARNPETLQRYRVDLIQPFIDLANIPDDANQVAAFVKRFGGAPRPYAKSRTGEPSWNRSDEALWNLAQCVKRGANLQELERTFQSVRDVLFKAESMPYSPDDDATYTRLDAKEIGETVPFRVNVSMEFMAGELEGYFTFQPDRTLFVFIDALGGWKQEQSKEKDEKAKRESKPAKVDPRRIRTCPVETCKKLYYAERKQVIACPEHRGLESVRRNRRKEKEQDYEETRRYRKRKGLKRVPAKEARERERLFRAIKNPTQGEGI